MTISSRTEAHSVPDWWPSWCKRVTIVAPRYPEVSGGSRFVENFSRALAEIGVVVRIFSLYPGRGPSDWPTTTVFAREGLHRRPAFRTPEGRRSPVRALLSLGFKRFDRIRVRRRMVRALNEHAANDIVIFTDVTAKRALDDLGVSSRVVAPQVGQHHSSFQNLEIDSGVASAVKRGFRSVDAFTALSRDDAERFGRLLGVPSFAVPNMISPREPAIEPLPRGSSTSVIALGRLSSEKQFEMLIPAFLLATNTHELRTWTLDIYGDGDQREYLDALVQEHGAQDRIRLRGVTHDVPGVLREASLHVVSSRYEGFGLSVLEAAQSGVPTIAFDCSPGLHDLMVSVHGVLVAPAEGVEGLAKGIRDLIEDPASLRERGIRAREGIAPYEPESVLRKWALVVRAAGERSRSRQTKPQDAGNGEIVSGDD